jgi:hypothetical protein
VAALKAIDVSNSYSVFSEFVTRLFYQILSQSIRKKGGTLKDQCTSRWILLSR